MEKQSRIIGEYTMGFDGPLLIGVGGLHGNETAGVEGIKRLLQLLNAEKYANPPFVFKGKFIGLRGNTSALSVNKRFIDCDLNRIWSEENVTDSSSEIREREDLEKTILDCIQKNVCTKVVILDLHTTSAPRGIFSVPTDMHYSLRYAQGLHCPVILNILDELKGSMIAFYGGKWIDNHQLVSLAFEAGQHQNPLSITMSVAAMVNCLRAIGNVHEDDVEGKHDDVLKAYAAGLPEICSIIYKYPVKDATKFEMLPGFEGFQKIYKGQLLAIDEGVEVFCPQDGRILMPLYQKQGHEGFFILNEA